MGGLCWYCSWAVAWAGVFALSGLYLLFASHQFGAAQLWYPVIFFGVFFREANDLVGRDGPSQFYLKLSSERAFHPPGEPWDGVVKIEGK